MGELPAAAVPVRSSAVAAVAAIPPEGAGVPEIAARIGRARSTTWEALCVARDLGLVSWDDRTHGTIRRRVVFTGPRLLPSPRVHRGHDNPRH